MAVSGTGRGNSPVKRHCRGEQASHGGVHPFGGTQLEPVSGVVAVRRGILVGLPHFLGLVFGTRQTHERGEVDHAQGVGLER